MVGFLKLHFANIFQYHISATYYKSPKIMIIFWETKRPLQTRLLYHNFLEENLINRIMNLE